MSANGTVFKAQAMMRDLKQRLQLTLTGSVTLTDALDINNFPNLLVQRGSENIWLHIEDAGNAGRVDGLGLPQRAYSPHVASMLEATSASDADLRKHCLVELAKCGTEVQVWEIASVATGAFTLSGATQVSDIRSDAVNPLTEQM